MVLRCLLGAVFRWRLVDLLFVRRNSFCRLDISGMSSCFGLTCGRCRGDVNCKDANATRNGDIKVSYSRRSRSISPAYNFTIDQGAVSAFVAESCAVNICPCVVVKMRICEEIQGQAGS
jgi:hypothetical protein